MAVIGGAVTRIAGYLSGMALGLGEGSLLAGRYRLERVLGAGGMATVWLARDERLWRAVAVKILSETLAADSVYVRRFRREARVAAGLSHPNLVKVYDFGSEDDRPYLAMEYVDGGSLAERISAGTARGLDLRRLARELLQALDHIHSAGVVHRDVKPGNVLIARDGTAKLTDFGIAQPEGATRLTSTGLVIGTRSFIAPEVERGEPATTRSDLYSCAMVLRATIGDRRSGELADLVSCLGDPEPGRRPQSASRALALLAAPSPSSGPQATTATEPLERDRTARTIPIGARPHRPRQPRMLIGPRPLATVTLIAALIVLAVVLLSGGDDRSSTGGGGAGDTTGGRARQQAPATSTVRATGREHPAPAEPPKASGKPNEEKPSKTPPGKAKGHSKP
jgi:eukaryotic-like serine/threonine-protein kinase